MRPSAYCLFKPRAVTVKAVNITMPKNNTSEGMSKKKYGGEKKKKEVFVFHAVNPNFQLGRRLALRT